MRLAAIRTCSRGTKDHDRYREVNTLISTTVTERNLYSRLSFPPLPIIGFVAGEVKVRGQPMADSYEIIGR